MLKIPEKGLCCRRTILEATILVYKNVQNTVLSYFKVNYKICILIRYQTGHIIKIYSLFLRLEDNKSQTGVLFLKL